MYFNRMVAGAFERLTVAGTAVGITSTVHTPVDGKFSGQQAVMAEIAVGTQNMLYCFNSGSHAGRGLIGLTTDPILRVYGHENISNFRIIVPTGNTGYVQVTCYFAAISDGRLLTAGNWQLLTVSNSAIRISTEATGTTKVNPTDGKWAGHKCEMVQFSTFTDNLRWRIDGGDPTGTVGMRLLSTSNTASVYGHQNIDKLRVIRETNDCEMYIEYFYL